MQLLRLSLNISLHESDVSPRISSVHCSENITDRTVCHCLQVKESQVADSVAIYGAESVKDVIRTCGAGGGCNSCHAKIRQLIEAHGVTDACAAAMPAML